MVIRIIISVSKFIETLIKWLAIAVFIITTILYFLPHKQVGKIEVLTNRFYEVRGQIDAGSFYSRETNYPFVRMDNERIFSIEDIEIGTRMIAKERIEIYDDDVFNGYVIASISEGQCFTVFKKPFSAHGIWNLIVIKTFCRSIPRF